MQAVMPTVVEEDRRSVPGDRDIEDGDPTNRLTMLCGQGERGGSAPIVANHEQPLLVQHVVYQSPDVLCKGFFVVSAVAAATSRPDPEDREQ